MITISEAAATRMKDIMAAQDVPGLFVRVGVSAGGCSGFSYAMGFDSEESDQDVYMTIQDMKVVVLKDDMKYLNGLEIDYEESGLSGGFTIHNPNAIVTCGCGSSFRTREEDESLAQPCED
ncbi:iron-sulfur cluster assembly accessory protein [Paenibacillus campi]|uniref:HesB/IscA family protein n=1 Tax=Paenibacillus campi TaxID=3106031 RepID=UPI002AFEDEFE|nr:MULTISPECIES: iron-sulfur cluster assembly accessory protein [unclassified Paenibacillus]